MNTVYKCLFFILLFAAPAFAQNVRVDNVTFSSVQGFPFLPGATITICTAAGSGLPCTPTVVGTCLSISDVTCNQSAALTSDAFGNYGFWIQPGSYTYTVTKAGFGGFGPRALTLACQPTATCTITAAQTINANLAVSGTATVTGPNLLSCRIENVRFIDAANSCGWAGTDFGSWFNSAQSDCPSPTPSGCIVDARSFTGNVTNGTAFTVGGSRPTTLLLGPLKLTTSQTVTIQQLSAVIGFPATDTDGSANIPASTIFQANTTNLACVVDFVGNLGTLRDVMVDGNKANNATVTNDGVCVHNARAVIERVSSARNQRHGIHVISTGITNQAQGTKILHTTAISNSGSGIRCEGSTDLYITGGSEVENNTLWGIDNFDCSGMRVVGPNDIGGNGSGGIQIQGISTGFKAVNNLIDSDLFGNQLGHDIFVEGGCSDSLTTLCSRSHTITGNVFIGLGSGAAANTFDAIKIQDSANNSITGNIWRSASPASYRYGLEIQQPNRTENLDTVAGNNIDATNSFGTGFILPQASTLCAANNDPANLCTMRFPSGAAVASSSSLPIAGSVSGTMIIAAPATGGGTVTGPPGTDTLAGLAAVQAFSNKTLNVPLTSGTGLQIFNTTTTCTTGAAVGSTCTTANISLPVAEADTSYRVSCTGKGLTAVPVVIATANASASQFTITIAALTAVAASFASYDCVAGHN